MTENIIKKTCKEQGLTYAQLGEQIGYSGDTLKNAASKNEISEPLQKAIELYMKTIEQDKELKEYAGFKSMIQKIAGK